MRGRSPLGNPVLWVVAAFVLPEVVKKCKPFARVVGDALVHAGEVFIKAGTETAKEEPKESVTDKKKEHEEVPPVHTATPAGQQEIEEHKTKEAAPEGSEAYSAPQEDAEPPHKEPFNPHQEYGH